MSRVEVVSEPALAELAETANREHEEVVASGKAMLAHAIRSGEALLALKERVPPGEWEAWSLAHLTVNINTGRTYMRIATHRHLLPVEMRDGSRGSIDLARQYLRGINPPRGGPGNKRSPHDETVKAEARRLHREGLPAREIARLLDVSTTAVGQWVSPAVMARARARNQDYARKRRKERGERERAERDRAVAKVGGSVAESYSMLRKTLQALDRAHANQTDREIRAALGAATSKLHSAEDEIVRALGIS